MYDALFALEALVNKAAEAVKANPLLVSNTDIGALRDIAMRITNKAERAVAAGAVRPTQK